MSPHVLLWSLALLACTTTSPPEAPPSPPPPSEAGVESKPVAIVNGRALTEEELQLALRGSAHGAPGEVARPDAIDALVTKELRAQEASRLQLPLPGNAQQRIRALEAEAAAARRDALADALHRHVAGQFQFTDEEARAWFDQHGEDLRTEVHVMQILFKGRAGLEQVQQRLAAGEPFEEVARSRFTVIPPGRPPWDLGYLAWPQVPDAWHGTLEKLRPGEVSDLISGPGGRFWIVKLVDRRLNPDTGFEQLKPAVIQLMVRERLGAATEALDAELARKAVVVRP